MNYGYEVRHPEAREREPEFDEPDCSPHPFDIMAIYSLYHKVPK